MILDPRAFATDVERELLRDRLRRRTSFFATKPVKPLEKIPFDFSYRFSCEDATCTGHKLMCTDWEMLELYRKLANGDASRWEEKFRLKFEQQMLHQNDTHFFVGTIHTHPSAWIIIGLFYPKRTAQLALI